MIDPRIPLGGQQFSLPNTLMDVAQVQGARKRNELTDVALQSARTNAPMDAEMSRIALAEARANQPVAEAGRQPAIDMQRLRSTVLAAERLRGYVEEGDLKGALADLESRKATLDARGTDSSDTQRAIASVQEAISTGDLTKVKAGLDKARETGLLYGIIDLSGGGNAAKPSALIEQYDRYLAQGGKKPFVNPEGNGDDFVTQFSQSQLGAHFGAPVNQPGIGVVQPSRIDPAQNVTLATEPTVNEAAAARANTEAAATTTGKTIAEKQIDLPRLEQNANQSIKIIDDLKSHPGLPFITGLFSKAPIVPGTDQAAADALAKQISGTTFLEAYNTLKGGGTITEIEGTKAQEAIGRLSRAQDQKDYVGALDDLREVFSNGLERARKQAAGPQHGQGGAAAPLPDFGSLSEEELKRLAGGQ